MPKQIYQYVPSKTPVAGDFVLASIASEGNKEYRVDVSNFLGGGVLPTNIVIVDPNATPETGKVYTTYTAARAYVATQVPTAINLWGIQINGTCAEDIYLDDFTIVFGNYKSSILDGGTIYSNLSAWTPKGTSPIKGFTLAKCTIDDTAGKGYFLFEDCTMDVVDGITNASEIIMKDCLFQEADFSLSNAVVTIINSMPVPGAVIVEFPATSTFNDCNFMEDTLPINFNGGGFNNCGLYFNNEGTKAVKDGSYVFNNCIFDGWTSSKYCNSRI